MPTYIVCDQLPTQTNNGLLNSCDVSQSQILTEQQIQTMFVSESMTPEQATELGLALWTSVAIVFGIRLIIKVMFYLEKYS